MTTPSSATSHSITSTAPPKCTPSTIIEGSIRNGNFDEYPIPPDGSAFDTSGDEPPWYFDHFNQGYGNFQYSPAKPVAAFHLTQQPCCQNYPGAIVHLNIPITYCNNTVYNLSFGARQNNTGNQQCTIGVSTQDALIDIGYFEQHPIPDSDFRFVNYGPVNWTAVTREGSGASVNAKGEWSDVLFFVVQCIDVGGLYDMYESLVEVDGVVVDVA
ncbi:MAG: hypothetical protein Q9170_002593 [Blastenia crenularia]